MSCCIIPFMAMSDDKIIKAVILAGGLGTRLRSVAPDVPKPMAPIDGRPFLEYVLENLTRQGVGEFVLCLSHMRGLIMDHFGGSWKGVPLSYSIEERPLGTGGAIVQAFRQFQLVNAIVLNGDTFLDADYPAIWRKFARTKLAMTLASVPDAARYGAVKTGNGHVVGFCEKGMHAKGLVNAGVYRIGRSLFENVPDGAFSFENDFLAPRISQLLPPYHETDGYFIDMGIPESYRRACLELPKLRLFGNNDGKGNDADG